MNRQKLDLGIAYFKKFPNQLKKSSGKFIEGKYGGTLFLNETPEFIQQCKQLSKENTDLTTYVSNTPLSSEELDELVGADNVTLRRGQTWHKQNKEGDKWTYSISTIPLNTNIEEEATFLTQFQCFLDDYTPKPVKYQPKANTFAKKHGILIFPKQDAHFDKYDIHGKNDIHLRFRSIEDATNEILTEAALFTRLDEVIYIVGSDQFNSEWTGTTTKGTPQSNILQYKESFEMICNHEITIIDNLLISAEKVNIKFIPGNHDRYVGISLILFLKAYYRHHDRITFEDSIECSKTHKYSNIGILFNHGDEQKPVELINRFPMIFKNHWSFCDNFYVFTGDKHTEKSMQVNGVNFYQVPQLSSAKGEWDDKKGFIVKGEMQAFLIKEGEGMTNIYKRNL